MDLNIPLDLSKHCIETEIRRLYNHHVNRYLKLRKQDTALETIIDALQKALSHVDFPQLRSTFPELNGHTTQLVYLLLDSESTFQIFINGQAVYKFEI